MIIITTIITINHKSKVFFNSKKEKKNLIQISAEKFKKL